MLKTWRNDVEADRKLAQLTSMQRQTKELAEERKRLIQTVDVSSDREANLRLAQLRSQQRISEAGTGTQLDQNAIDREFQNAMDNVQAAFTQTFREIFSGGVTTFEDIAQQAQQIFVELAANLATMAIFQPQQFQQLFGAAGAAGQPGAAGQTGAAGTAAGTQQMTTTQGVVGGLGLGFGAGMTVGNLAGGDQTNVMIGSAAGAAIGTGIGFAIGGPPSAATH